MTSIAKSKLLIQMNAHLINLPNYIDGWKIIGVSIDRLKGELIIDFNKPLDEYLIAKEYMEQIEPHFRDKYDRIN